MRQNGTTEDLLERLSVERAYFTVTLPLVISMMVTIIYGLVDMYFVSATSDVNLIAGVSLIAPIYTLLLAIGDIIGYGSRALIAQYIGKKDHLKTRQISSFSFWCAVGCGALASILLLLLKGPVIRMLGADANTLRHGEAYYFWIVLAAPSVLLYCTFLNILSTVGKAKEALIAVLSGTLVNLALDPILIFHFGMGAAGASLSTFIGMSVEAAACLWIGFGGNDALSISPRYIRLDSNSIRKILSIGFSSSLTNGAQTVAMVVTNLYLVQYSVQAVSAMGIVQKVALISYLLILGCALGGQTLLGCAYGADNKQKIREILTFQIKVCMTLAIALTLLIECFAPRIMSLFIHDAEIITIGSGMLRIQYSATMFLTVILILFSLGIAVGEARIPLVLSLSRQGVIFIACVVVLSWLFGYYGVILAQPVADLLTAIFALALFRKKIGTKLR